MCGERQEHAMVAEIQKLETAARMAMGHFEDPTGTTSAKPLDRLPRRAYVLLALAVIGLAIAFF
jgi:hypothetical protein